MPSATRPYALPQHLEPDLARVLAYWEGLKRGEANMPFWDDASISDLPDLRNRIVLLDVFANPVRFRIAVIGDEIKSRQDGELVGEFLDEIEFLEPLRYLHSQSSATVESRAPTYYCSRATDRDAGYSRLLLPMWGDGHIGMLLGVVAQAHSKMG
jgi:Na+-transporting NADH:ubiquinone oxidoreductase subunit NqrC